MLGLSIVLGLTDSKAVIKLAMLSFCKSEARIADVPNARVTETDPNAANRATV